MAERSGPFKVILQQLERRASPDTLGDPTATRVQAEVARLFQLDEDTASSIVSAMPIVVLDGLDVRTAGVVRERLACLGEAGCRVVTTDDRVDTIPRVNWPELPPIARVPDEPTGPAGVPAGSAASAGLVCPCCHAALRLLPATSGADAFMGSPAPTASAARSAAPEPRHEPRHEPSSHLGRGLDARATLEPRHEPSSHLGRGLDARTAPEPAPRPEPSRREAAPPSRAEPVARARSLSSSDEDWLSPPRPASLPSEEPRSTPAAAPTLAAAAPPLPAAPPPKGSGRFDDAALLALREPKQPAPVLQLEDDLDELDLDEPSPAPRGARAAAAPGASASFHGESAEDPFGELAPPAPSARGAVNGRAAPTSRGSSSFHDESADDPFGELAPPAPSARGAPARAASTSRGSSSFHDESADDPFGELAPPAPSARGAVNGRAAPSRDPFEDSLLDLPEPATARPAERAPSGGSRPAERDPLEDSGSDVLDVPPPHRRGASPFASAHRERSSSALDDDDLDVLDDEPRLLDSDDEAPRGRSAPAAAATKPRGRGLLDSDDDPLGGLGDEPARGAPTRPGRAPGRGAPPAGGLLDDSVEAPPGPARRRSSGGGAGPDLDDVLSMFGPEDGRPLDDGAGLEPAPLDLSPDRGGRGRPPRRGGADDDLSDILEPLDPNEALEIIKTQRPPARGGRGSTSGVNGRANQGGLEALDEDEAFALLQSDEADPPAPRRKKSRGVPFPASGEDVGLLESGGRPARKKTDPFARARKTLAEERVAPAPTRRERSEPRTDARTEARTDARTDARRTGPRAAVPEAPAPSGGGDHGLVLSRIADAEKKEEAAELIAQIKGCAVDEARRLTDRTIIPVLKGVSRETAEHHLERFKRIKVAGRVTTRQRS